MAQVTVTTADGRFTTTANDEAREGEEKSELERLLAGEIEGREGYVGGKVVDASTTTDADEGDDSLTGDFSSLFGKLKEAIEDFYKWIEQNAKKN